MLGKSKGTRGAAPAHGPARPAGGARRNASGPRRWAGGARGKARLSSGTARGGSEKPEPVGTPERRKSSTAKYAKYSLHYITKDPKTRKPFASMTMKEFLFSQGLPSVYVSDDQTETITECPDGRIEAEARHPKAIAASRRPYKPLTGNYTTEELIRVMKDEALTLEEARFRGRVRVIREATKS